MRIPKNYNNNNKCLFLVESYFLLMNVMMNILLYIHIYRYSLQKGWTTSYRNISYSPPLNN